MRITITLGIFCVILSIRSFFYVFYCKSFVLYKNNVCNCINENRGHNMRELQCLLRILYIATCVKNLCNKCFIFIYNIVSFFSNSFCYRWASFRAGHEANSAYTRRQIPRSALYVKLYLIFYIIVCRFTITFPVDTMSSAVLTSVVAFSRQIRRHIYENSDRPY